MEKALCVVGGIAVILGIYMGVNGWPIVASIITPIGLICVVVGGVLIALAEKPGVQPKATPQALQRQPSPPASVAAATPADWQKLAVMDTDVSGVFAVDHPNRRDMDKETRTRVEAFYREAEPGRPIQVFYEAHTNPRTGWQQDFLELRDHAYESFGYIPRDTYHALKREFRTNPNAAFTAQVEAVIPQNRGLPIVLVRIRPSVIG
jgi:hypothetical protein